MPAGKPLILPGWGSQTAAVQALVAGRARPSRKRKTTTRKKRATVRKRPAKKRRTTAARKRTTRRTKKPSYMVKGSAAAKRHMAKLRRMRKG